MKDMDMIIRDINSIEEISNVKDLSQWPE